MIKAIKDFFDLNLGLETAGTAEQTNTIELATAALLLEVAKQDYKKSDDPEAETRQIITILQNLFNLSEDNLEDLMRLAETEAREATDFYQFTQLVNDHYSYQDKVKLMENLWRVAHADGRLDRYEEHFLRRVSGLLHLSHSDFIQTKISARN